MRSKTEIIDALERCKMKEWTCDQCKYYPLGDHCWDALHSDILELLNKSDFEVTKEILEKSEEYHNDYSYEIQGNDYPTIILHRGTQMLWVDFDDKGNIL